MNALPDSLAAAGETSSPRAIVCERGGRWAAALRQALVGGGVRVFETRDLADAWRQLQQRPASVLVVEFARAEVATLLDRLAKMKARFPRACVVVVAQRTDARWEWLLREAGAAHFVVSTRQMGGIARLVLRHLARAPDDEATPAERIWRRLPWSADG